MIKLAQELLLIAIPIVLLFLGGALSVFRTASKAFKSSTLHFAAGVVFSVVAVELLPDMIRLHNTVIIVVGFITGIVTMLLIKEVTGRLEREKEEMTTHSLPWPAISAVAIDLFIDGILLGIGFAAGRKEGLLLAIALSLECFSLGIAIVGTIRKATIGESRIFFLLAGLGATFIIGAVAGLGLLHNAPDMVMEFILSFGASALLYLVTEELLVEAHQEKDSPLFTGLFFAGFLIFLVLGIVL